MSNPRYLMNLHIQEKTLTMDRVSMDVCGRCAEQTFKDPCEPDSPCTGTTGEGAFTEDGHCQVCKDLTYVKSVDADSATVVKLLLQAPEVRITRAAAGIRRTLRVSK